MNSSLITADGTTHLKILAIALAAAILVMWVGISARPGAGDNLSANPRTESNMSGPDMPRSTPWSYATPARASSRA